MVIYSLAMHDIVVYFFVTFWMAWKHPIRKQSSKALKKQNQKPSLIVRFLHFPSPSPFTESPQPYI